MYNVEALMALCHPNAEAMSEKQRIDAFVEMGLGAANEITSLRAALIDARPFVADSGDDEDPDASRSASEVVEEIDRLIPTR